MNLKIFAIVLVALFAVAVNAGRMFKFMNSILKPMMIT